MMQQTTISATDSDIRPTEAQGRAQEAERLRREHGELEMRIRELDSRVYLSPIEQLERKTLQKLKLVKKDRIAALMVSYSGTS